jgi:hypothetical protein
MNFKQNIGLFLPYDGWHKKGSFIFLRRIEVLEKAIQGEINPYLPDDKKFSFWKKDLVQDITLKTFGVTRSLGQRIYLDVRKRFVQYHTPKKRLDKHH